MTKTVLKSQNPTIANMDQFSGLKDPPRIS
jgi:hypothetical protein